MTKNQTKIRNAIISCYDKTGLKYFGAELVRLNPEIRIYSSSGTYNELKKAVSEKNLVEISEYTGTKEMPSGLVKTLNPKVHSGILAELDDEPQKKYLEDIHAVEFDLVVVNLYPFAEASAGSSIEKARTNIDIGGVSLIEAGCKNFLRVTVAVSPVDYELILESLRKNNSVGIDLRLKLAKIAMNYISAYLNNISCYFNKLTEKNVKNEYKVE
jgi:phosphoribosylaminoimidazolecarboxamide formyltransferase / IMP cyclohydrolase